MQALLLILKILFVYINKWNANVPMFSGYNCNKTYDIFIDGECIYDLNLQWNL